MRKHHSVYNPTPPPPPDRHTHTGVHLLNEKRDRGAWSDYDRARGSLEHVMAGLV